MRSAARLAAAITLASLSACGTEKADNSIQSQLAVGRDDPASSAPESNALPRRSPVLPASPCDWISASEVEAIVGKLSGAPRAERGGCFYPLPMDAATIARLARADSTRAALELAGLKPTLPPEPADTAGVFIQVTVGSGAAERPTELAFGTMGSWIDDDSLFTARKAEHGWDYGRSLPGKPNFIGRAGTVMVAVEGGTHGMDNAVLATLARRVRDSIPDLPFAAPVVATPFPVAAGRDPCSVLSREEAEAVLGKLIVAPYRTSKGALAHPTGRSCAYYSGSHRALVVTPHFAGGADEMRFIRGRSGLGAIGIVDGAAEAADTLEGPWDEVAIGVEGQLAVMRGDRMVEIAYLTSSTDLAGAIRLAGPALERLESAK